MLRNPFLTAPRAKPSKEEKSATYNPHHPVWLESLELLLPYQKFICFYATYRQYKIGSLSEEDFQKIDEKKIDNFGKHLEQATHDNQQRVIQLLNKLSIQDISALKNLLQNFHKNKNIGRDSIDGFYVRHGSLAEKCALLPTYFEQAGFRQFKTKGFVVPPERAEKKSDSVFGMRKFFGIAGFCLGAAIGAVIALAVCIFVPGALVLAPWLVPEIVGGCAILGGTAGYAIADCKLHARSQRTNAKVVAVVPQSVVKAPAPPRRAESTATACALLLAAQHQGQAAMKGKPLNPWQAASMVLKQRFHLSGDTFTSKSNKSISMQQEEDKFAATAPVIRLG